MSSIRWTHMLQVVIYVGRQFSAYCDLPRCVSVFERRHISAGTIFVPVNASCIGIILLIRQRLNVHPDGVLSCEPVNPLVVGANGRKKKRLGTTYPRFKK